MKRTLFSLIVALVVWPLHAGADDYTNPEPPDPPTRAELDDQEDTQEDNQGTGNAARDDDDADQDDGAADRFQDLNARADEAAESGDFQAAIKLWQESIQYDRSPYVDCRGALQGVYIRVAQHVLVMMNRGDLDADAAFPWFKAKVTNIWGNSGCNSPSY